jgi:hypothetical protein
MQKNLPPPPQPNHSASPWWQVGIKEGGRTGLTAVTVAACFALSLFFAPLLQVGGVVFGL